MSSSLRTAIVGFGAVIALLSGCGVEGYTPDCTDNVSTNGIGPAGDDGCEHYGSCVVDQSGNICTPSADPAQPDADCPGAHTVTGRDAVAKACCKDDKGQVLTDYQLEFCLYGYGAVDVNSGTPGK